MDIPAKLYTSEWLNEARNASPDSWASDVSNSLDRNGAVYLAHLQNWYNSLPMGSDTSGHLMRRLQNHKNDQHLGGANELAWWAFMKSSGFSTVPVATADGSRPDYYITSPCKFYAEVTTLNPSERDEVIALTLLAGAQLSPKKTLARISTKCDEKSQQLKYGFDQDLPSILVVFDYSAFSGFDVSTNVDVEKALVTDRTDIFSDLTELSALVYVVRSMSGGHPVFIQSKSIVFHNPMAKYPLNLNVFPYLIQHNVDIVLEPILCSGGIIQLGD